MAELTSATVVRNPYPGLRPFRADEERLFFGREHQVDRMIDKLAANRFLAVVGGSGSGKSSLVNCGLRPALHRGNMTSAGAAWRMAQFRPGNDPIGALARALAEPGVLFTKPMTGPLSADALVEATLRLGSLGLVDIVGQMQLPAGTQVLVVVDQFEELFRFRSLERDVARDAYGQAEDSVAFVRLLLEARAQTAVPIHMVLTMRSDFLGDCSQFQGLPEAINEGQYLVPRLTREEIRAAITGPTAVAGATISSLLVTRLLNDVGDNPDQLSILQHALNRTWSQWEGSGENGPLDLPHYQVIGTMTRALDQHAEKAYAELTTERQRQICEKLFKALTDKATDPRGVRRPTRLDTLCALAEATQAEITQVIDVFRKPSRSFLMPPAEDKLDSETVIDISHESLMRVWERLKTLADQEAQSAHIYTRLADTVKLHGEGKAGFLDDPDLQVALDWQEKYRPNKDWAQLYDPGFNGAMAFLQKSKEERDAEVAEIEFGRKMRNVRNVIVALMLTLFLLWDPLHLKAPAPLTYTVEDSVKNKLKQAHILTLPEAVISDLPGKLEKWRLNYPLVEKFKGALGSERRNEDFRAENIEAVLRSNFVGLPIGVIPGATDMRLPQGTGQSSESAGAVFMKTLQEKGPVVAAIRQTDFDFWLSNTGAPKNKQIDLLLAANGIVIKPDDEFPRDLVLEELYALPDSVRVVAGKQTPLISLVLRNTEGFLLLHPAGVALAAEIIRILVHLLGYFALLFGVGAIYRRFGFGAIGSAEDPAWAADPWSNRLRSFQTRANKLLKLFQSRRTRVVFSALILLGGISFFVFGLFRFRVAAEDAPLLAPLGLILILLVPTYGILKTSWAARFKVVQGILLQLGGVYALTGLFFLLIAPDVEGPGLLLVRNRLVLAIGGIGLLILGTRKRDLTAEETLARDPDRAPILHFRSFENENRNQKERGVSWIDDEQILRPIFGVLGPFATLPYSDELSQQSAVFTASAIPGNLPPETTELRRKPALVILQIDNRLTYRFLSQIRQTLDSLRQTFKPDQVLVYFSHKIDPAKLTLAYQKLVDVTRDMAPGQWPASIDSNRFLAFEDHWQPFPCGPVTAPRFSWGKVIPVLGNKIDAARRSRAITRALRPFFERRNLVNSQKKLFGDWAIGLSAFPLFGWGLPAGVMISRNLWSTGRRWKAGIGLFAPTVGLAGIVCLEIAWFVIGSSNQLQIEAAAFLTMGILGFPFATSWVWRRLSGREIRQHLAFGGAIQPLWKVFVMLIVVASLTWSPLTLFVYLKQRERAKDYNAYSEVQKGSDLAMMGAPEEAIVAFEAAQRFDPEIDLDRRTDGIQKDPKAVANHLAASSQVSKGNSLAIDGEIEKAIAAFAAAQKLDPEIDLDQRTEGTQKDPKTAAQEMAVHGKAEELILLGTDWAGKRDFEKAFQAYDQAITIDKSLETNSAFWNRVGWTAGISGHAGQALVAGEKAVRFAVDPRDIALCRDTRGLARALTGNTKGAIEDFEAAIASDFLGKESNAQRQGWVDSLRKGQQPFTPEVLKTLQP